MVHGLQISIAKGSITTVDGLNSQGPFFTAQIDRKSSLASGFLELFGFFVRLRAEASHGLFNWLISGSELLVYPLTILD